MSFRIDWTIPEQEWEKAKTMRMENLPESDYDKGYGPHYDLLYGDVQISYQDKKLWNKPFNLSVADLAHALNYILVTEKFDHAPEGNSTQFQQSDDALEIKFEKSRGYVLITENVHRSSKLEVPEQEFFDGLRGFLKSFVDELLRRAPALLEWESLAMLRLHHFGFR